MKDPYATTNTRYIYVDGCKQIKKPETMRDCRMLVLFTSDDLGETLSITDDKGVQLMVPWGPVAALIKEARDVYYAKDDK